MKSVQIMLPQQSSREHEDHFCRFCTYYNWSLRRLPSSPVSIVLAMNKSVVNSRINSFAAKVSLKKMFSFVFAQAAESTLFTK